MSAGPNFGAGPDPNQTTSEAADWFQFAIDLASNNGLAGSTATGAAVAQAIDHARIPSRIIKFVGTLVGIAADIAAAFLNMIDQIKQNSGDGFRDLLASSVNEMLGTDLSGSDLTAGSGGASSMDQNLAIGEALLSQFETAFGGAGAVDAQQGADNARKFAGWAVSFATSQGFLSILTEAASVGFLKEFHELPQAVQEGLGLGRLQRLALQPLIQMAIQKPYTAYCNDKFRPTRLGEAQLVKGLHSGQMQESDVRQQLSELGYADSIQDFVLTDFAVKLALAEQITLLNNGDITENDIVNNLTLAGMPQDQANLQIKAAQENEAKGEYSALLTLIESSYVNGFIDEATYNDQLSKLPISDNQAEAFRARVGFQQETTRKKLSFADVKTAVVDGVVDFTYVDKWMATEGYDIDSQNILTFQILKAMTKATEKEAYAQYKIKQLQIKGKPVPPWLQDQSKGV